MKSAAEFFRLANGREVIKRVEGAACVEDWPDMVAKARASFEAQGAIEGRDYTVTDDSITCGNQFLRRPRLQRESRGVMTVRSGDYSVKEAGGPAVFGDKKGATIEGGRLVKAYPGFRITFELVA